MSSFQGVRLDRFQCEFNYTCHVESQHINVHCTHTHTQEKARPHMSAADESCLMKEIGMVDDDDDNPVLLSAVQLREDTTLSPVSEDSPTKKRIQRLSESSNSQHQEEDKDSVSSDDRRQIDPFEIEEDTSRAQRPTILKRSNHPIRVSTTYTSTVSPPLSPTGSSSNSHHEKQTCCTIL